MKEGGRELHQSSRPWSAPEIQLPPVLGVREYFFTKLSRLVVQLIAIKFVTANTHSI